MFYHWHHLPSSYHNHWWSCTIERPVFTSGTSDVWSSWCPWGHGLWCLAVGTGAVHPAHVDVRVRRASDRVGGFNGWSLGIGDWNRDRTWLNQPKTRMGRMRTFPSCPNILPTKQIFAWSDSWLRTNQYRDKHVLIIRWFWHPSLTWLDHLLGIVAGWVET